MDTDRVARLMDETGLSQNAVRRRIQRGESDEQIREWGKISAQINAEHDAAISEHLRSYRAAVIADVVPHHARLLAAAREVVRLLSWTIDDPSGYVSDQAAQALRALAEAVGEQG